MKEYNVVFHYSVRVEADDEDDAQDKAWSEFGEANPSSGDNFACTVEAIEDVWDTNEDGNHICVDCETEVDPDEVCGNKEFSDPRCEGCYDTHRYSA
jgi:hypothetical protein